MVHSTVSATLTYNDVASSASEDSEDTDEDTDDGLNRRGRDTTRKHVVDRSTNGTIRPEILISKRKPSTQRRDSSSTASHSPTPPLRPPRSPATLTPSVAVFHHALSNGPSPPSFYPSRQKLAMSRISILPAYFRASIRIPFTQHIWKFSIDAALAGECSLLLCSTFYAISKVTKTLRIASPVDIQATFELRALLVISAFYTIWTHSRCLAISGSTLRTSIPNLDGRRSASRDIRRSTSSVLEAENDTHGFIWMTVPKNYRSTVHDGCLTILLLGPLLTVSVLYSSLTALLPGNLPKSLPSAWRIEYPLTLPSYSDDSAVFRALFKSRLNLLDISTLCASITFFHIISSTYVEYRARRRLDAGKTIPESERASVPRQEGKRFQYYASFALGVSLGVTALRELSSHVGPARTGIWKYMSPLEVLIVSVFYQFSLYIAIRLANRGFTLGELGLVAYGATVLFMELINLTIARIWPITTPFLKTYRLPTPLLIFQIALIPGSLLVGFLTSPLLYLSRHIARRPARRLRFPEEKEIHRRALAAGFYILAALIVGGVIGMWTRWQLVKRDPWLWVIFWLLEGRRPWSRPALLAYWSALGSLSVAGWNRQLARSRRFRHRFSGSVGPTGSIWGVTNPSTATGDPTVIAPPSSANAPIEVPVAPSPMSEIATSDPPPAPASSMGLTFANLPNLPDLRNLPNLPNTANVSQTATELLDAADRHVPTLGLNARRKFFHGLAVVMFLPGIAYDPAFAHFSFSAAFALFTFAEYVRYFALYPFGAIVHLFLNEFLDSKDSGTAILSHFYLLTGCAGSVWLDGRHRSLEYTGLLALGVGDALASIVGKRIGRHQWSPLVSKTFEGSTAFVLSIVGCALLLRVCGLTEAFSIPRYTLGVSLAALLEALSVQNDNLTLPLYMWSMLALVLD